MHLWEEIKGRFELNFTGRNPQNIKGKSVRSTNFTLKISDNGVGIPENLKVENLDSLGMQLITSLVRPARWRTRSEKAQWN